LELLRMKITAKVARHGFDLRYFFETIDFKGAGSLKFVHFLAIMKERFSLYLSEEEIEALFLYFIPAH
jgi:Ca2+-binding EF-hand superfamily protein